MRARIVAIGNSRGVRIPRALLEQAGLGEHVELHAEPGRITIEALNPPRSGWSEAAAAMHTAGDDDAILGAGGNAFDREEWKWQRR